VSDYISKLRDLLLQQSKTGRLSSLLDSIYGAASTGAEAYGAANSPMAPQHAAGLLGTIADLTPVVGDVKSAYEGVQAAREGDWAGAGLGLLGALPFVPGITAWHGSPHKFDKFSLDKIGTGEGAQAYGHGLYLAENPSVAREYQERLGGFQPSEITSQFKELIAGLPASAQKFLTESQAARTPIDQMKQKALQSKVQAASWDAQDVKKGLAPSRAEYVSAMDEALAFLEKNALPKPPNPGQMYKTDIPDEAVARFLDWDKPLSQQAPEVHQRLKAAIDGKYGKGFLKEFDNNGGDLRDLLYNFDDLPNGGMEAMFKQQGIPGIRYLDGGSRATGKGSSNFVVFDDQLPRILERNGVPTGNNPWGKGEWKPK